MSWKGYAQDSATPTPRPGRWRAPAPDRPTTPARSTAARRTARPVRPAARPTPTPAAPTRPTSTSPSTSRSRGSSRSCSPATATRRTSPTCSIPSNGLYHDLQSEATTPAFSWITPNNCSDGHDAVCHGNNLSGGFSDPNTPNAPVNYTGGLYAADLFLEHVVPEIEASPAFKDGGLIDVTFDEGFPPFTYTGNSFANSTTDAPTAATSIETDSGRRDAVRLPCTPSRPGRTRRSRPTTNGDAALSGPGLTTPTSTVRPTASRRYDRDDDADAGRGTGERLPHRRRRPHMKAAAGTCSDATDRPGQRGVRCTTIDDNSIVRRRGSLPSPAAASRPAALVGQVTDTPVAPRHGAASRAAAGRRRLVHSSSTRGGNPLPRPGAVSGDHARRRDGGDRPAVRRR